MRYTLYVERDIALEGAGDDEAARVAEAFDRDLDVLLTRWIGAGVQELAYARTTCHRGLVNKKVYDREEGDP